MTPHARGLVDTLHRDLFRGYQLLARLPHGAARTRAFAELDGVHAALAAVLTDGAARERFETDLALLDQQLMSALTQLSFDTAAETATPAPRRVTRVRAALHAC